jgi:D-aminopeptidase
MTDAWYRACVDMTRDVNTVARALFDAGVIDVAIHDFHRTGYNLLPEMIDSRAKVFSGYKVGPVPGIGDPGNAEGVVFLGMHASSGSEGFLAHTLTSRIKRLEVNGKLLSEVELFAAALGPFGVRPILFSGCPVACAQAGAVISGIHLYPIDKTKESREFDADSWRTGLAQAVDKALDNASAEPYRPVGPCNAVLTMRDGEGQAKQLASRWGFAQRGAQIFIETPDIRQLYDALIKLCYLTPLTERMLPLALLSHKLVGRFGLAMVRRRVRTQALDDE